jgi:hypothetical protein
LKSGKSVRVCANGWGANLPPDQLVDDNLISFGVGANAQTVLVNKDGEVSIYCTIHFNLRQVFRNEPHLFKKWPEIEAFR